MQGRMQGKGGRGSASGAADRRAGEVEATSSAAPGTVLLVHSGELADVRELLEQARIPSREMRPGPTAISAYLAATLVISSAPFLLDRLRDGQLGRGQRIAILESESRTARSILARGGVEWMVRRPAHPAALRLLVLHCLYHGPEKRKARRVTIGAKVRYRTGWRPRSGILAELSQRDCRILAQGSVPIAARVKLRLPPEIAGRRALRLEGRVVRVAPAPDSEGASEICLVFDTLGAIDASRLCEIVAAHERGPAVLQGARPATPKRESTPPRQSVIALGAAGPETPDSESGPAAAATRGTPGTPERRGDPRLPFDRRVIAMSEQATRVLVGRDISLGGMRVSPTPSLALGDELQIAIHVPGQETPLVLHVKVTRDDGEHGLLMNFCDLSKIAKSYLEDVLANLSGLASGDEDSSTGETARVVSEILEHRTG